jgi:3',5'-cyclic AMP phosphodiesterase CpdA
MLSDLHAQRPDLIVVTGDLTERAFAWQFRKARGFLDRLPSPWVATPGNHDVPLLPLDERVHRPRARFARHIDPAPTPVRQVGGTWVAGLCTAHGATWKDGRIAPDLLDQVCALTEAAPAGARRLIIAHHPFQPPPDAPDYRLVDGWEDGLRRLSAAGTDIVLGGHIHRAYAVDAAVGLGLDRPLIVVQAPTAISPHLRDRPNGYNLLTLGDASVQVATRYWDGHGFTEEITARLPLGETAPERSAVA